MAIYKINVLAGDFKKGKAHDFCFGKFHLTPCNKQVREEVSPSEIDSIQAVSEDASSSVGTFLLGGLIGTGIKSMTVGLKETTFTCKFKDGRKLMATMPTKGYLEIQACLF